MTHDYDTAWDDLYPSCPTCGDFVRPDQEFCSEDCAKNSAYIRNEDLEDDADNDDAEDPEDDEIGLD